MDAIEKMQRKEAVVGTFFELGGMAAVECLGIAGLDFLIIDTEHGPFDVESAMDYIRAAELKGITPFVRVREISRPAILKMLDVGARALIIPNVETVEQVRQIVDYGKYAPLGRRGFFMARSASYGFADHAQEVPGYFKYCNEHTMLIPQCETQGCLDHIEEIVNIDGVDGIFIGPYDLSIGMGLAAQFDHPDFIAAIHKIYQTCQKAGKPCLLYVNTAAEAKQYLEKGFAGAAINMDATFYIQAFRSLLQEVRVSE